MKRLAVGILAHVDSGKTTLAEGMLYYTGEIRNLGRVDHKNTFFDTHFIERKRGITIFSKQAEIKLNGTEFTLLDTPGHVDFSAETERVLQIMDYAILVINGAEGVQSHTITLWKLLEIYKIPVFIFINKMDFSNLSADEVFLDIKKQLNENCIDFGKDNFFEDIALTSEDYMQEYLETEKISDIKISKAVKNRKIYPCIFGSALKMQKVDKLLSVIEKYTLSSKYKDVFSARVFKISEDEKGTRLTHIKITGGYLKVREIINGTTSDGEEWKEKINQIRIYSGSKFRNVDIAEPGMICTLTGLSKTYIGEGLGDEKNSEPPSLEPVLSYKVEVSSDVDIKNVLTMLKKLESEEPELNIIWNENLQEIHIRLMGAIQLEIIKNIIAERFKIDIEFTNGKISYKETIKSKSEGIGHYEPLRHYAEVHLILEPLPTGSGLKFNTKCSENNLNWTWQKLILNYLKEKQHIGVLTGSPITDMKITLVSGKYHLKHTEGGDFRQAVYRAVRNGLRKAESVLLEPYYGFSLEIPSEFTGRAMSDLQLMDAEFSSPEILEYTSIIKGIVPVETICNYQKELAGYTKGKGKLSCMPSGYRPCRNQDKIIENIGYNCDEDLENTADSVFCSHGAGFSVKWDEVEKYMHINNYLKPEKSEEDNSNNIKSGNRYRSGSLEEDKELMKIFENTYGKIKRDSRSALHTVKENNNNSEYKYKPDSLKKGEYVIVDGYNMIFCWDELNKQAKQSLDLARNTLINKMCNYQGFKKCRLILVFDAYKVKENKGTVEKNTNIEIVYTKENETADSYIERISRELGKEYTVRVATSDNLEQIIIMGNGAYRISASEFYAEVKNTEKAMEEYSEKFSHFGNLRKK